MTSQPHISHNTSYLAEREKACCIFMRHYEVKKLQEEKLSQTGGEGVLLLS